MSKMKNERGAAVVEFAIIAPLLLTLLLGIIQSGILYNRQQGIHAAAREGARIGSISGVEETEILEHINRGLDGVALDANPTIVIKECGEGADPDIVTITIQAETETFVPYLASLIEQQGQGSFRCER